MTGSNKENNHSKSRSDEKDPTFWKRSFRKWFQRLGWAGFLFFLIKGLIWLGVFIFIGKCSQE